MQPQQIFDRPSVSKICAISLDIATLSPTASQPLETFDAPMRIAVIGHHEILFRSDVLVIVIATLELHVITHPMELFSGSWLRNADLPVGKWQ